MKNIFIVKNNITDYAVVIPDNATECEVYSAKELVKYLKVTVGKELDIVKESEHREKNAIYIGRCLKSAKHYKLSKYGEEGFVISVFDNSLFITGNEKRGTLYGVYTFLEEFCGWRFFTQDTEILLDGDVTLEEGIFEEQFPQLEWRDVAIPAYMKCDISAKRKINSSYLRPFTEEMGGSFLYPGRFVHTMESLLDVPQHQQPCFSDEENLKKCIENVKKLCRGYPEARIISVTQNDNEIGAENFCKCEKCRKIDEEEGSHAGSLLRFVNAVADAIKDEYPKVKIMTLAYLHTCKCPSITKPRDNVIIEFAPMELCYNHQVYDPECEINQEFLDNFRKWCKIAKTIYLWDYNANFSFTVPHFPNFHTIRKNIVYYLSHNVRGMFCEGDNYYDDHITDMVELRAYLLSKLLWNPHMSEEEFERHMDEFLEGYYGRGGKYIKEYLGMLAEAARLDNEGKARHIRCYQNPQHLFSVDYIVKNDDKMNELWEKAYELCETDLQREHVDRSRLGYIYSSLLYTFDRRMEAAKTEEEKQALIARNEAFYRGLEKNNIEPRGWQSKLPEMTDFTQNAGVKIYW